MAEKHKSKYKAPKDLEKSQKLKPRKDLKDYTEDDKTGALNPKSTGEKQQNVLRKTDKEVVDNGDMYVKYNADDRLYKDLEDGEYDPKHAAKVLKKRQDNDEKDNAKNIKDKLENLTREQKEQFVRKYVQRKLNSILSETMLKEQPAPDEPATEEPTAEDPTAAPVDPATDPTAAAPADTAIDMGAPAAEPAPAPAPDATAAPATDAAAEPQPEPTPVDKFASDLAKEGNVGKFKLLNKLFNSAFNEETDPEDKATFYRMLRSLAIKKLGKMQSAAKTAEE